jgi:hypothetical protein
MTSLDPALVFSRMAYGRIRMYPNGTQNTIDVSIMQSLEVPSEENLLTSLFPGDC